MPCLGVFNVVALGDFFVVALATLAGLGSVAVGLFGRWTRLQPGVFARLAIAVVRKNLAYVAVNQLREI